MDELDNLVRSHNASAYVIYASSADPDMRYLSGFSVTDPVVFLKKPEVQGILIVPDMEESRAVYESCARVITRTMAGFHDIMQEEKDITRAYARMIHQIAGGSVVVPSTMQVGLAHALEEFDRLFIDTDTVSLMRARKTSTEITAIQQVQAATNKAMDRAIRYIKGSSIQGDYLYHNGTPLTSEMIKQEIQITLFHHGCIGSDTIVSGGNDTAHPHATGSGILPAFKPIIIDIFPRSEKTGYHSDMTRTISKGRPDSAVIEMYNTVRDVLQDAEAAVRSGIRGSDLYQRALDIFDNAGYGHNKEGFIHSLGHGVGLEVHELPTLSRSGELLKTGHVITLEPGLYYPGIGGVRIEDIGLVKEDHFENWTHYNKELVV